MLMWPLSNDVLCHVFGFLCYADLSAAWHANPRWFLATHSRFPVAFFVDRALRKLYMLDPAGFRRALLAHKAVLTGSFVLWAITGDQTWIPGDLDVMTLWQPNDPFLFWLFDKFGGRCLAQELGDLPQERRVHRNTAPPFSQEKATKFPSDRAFYVEPVEDGPEDNRYLGKLSGERSRIIMTQDAPHKRCVDCWTYSGAEGTQYPLELPLLSKTLHFPYLAVPVNHLHMYEMKTPLEFIETFFDVDFCKMSFDGSKLRVFSWHDIWARKSVLSWANYSDIHKNDFQSQPGASWLYARLVTRQRRYRERGFEITMEGATPPSAFLPP